MRFGVLVRRIRMRGRLLRRLVHWPVFWNSRNSGGTRRTRGCGPLNRLRCRMRLVRLVLRNGYRPLRGLGRCGNRTRRRSRLGYRSSGVRLNRLTCSRCHLHIRWRSDHRAARNRSGRDRCFHWRRNGPCIRRGRNGHPLGVDQNRTCCLHRHRTHRRMSNDRAWRCGDRGLRQNLHAAYLLRIDMHCGLSHGASGGKVLLPHGCHADCAVDICKVGHVGDVHYVHVSGLNVHHTRRGDVRDVDLIYVARTAGIPRPVSFARSQRKPRRNCAATGLHAARKDNERW